MTVLYTQHGFVVNRPPASYVAGEFGFSDARINQVYTELTDPKHNCDSWEWRRGAIALCLQLLAGSDPLFKLQVGRGIPVQPRVVDVCYDTFRYLTMGRRRMPLANWRELLDLQPVHLSPPPSRVVRDFEGELWEMPTERLVARWLQQPHGLTDLISFCMLAYGDYSDRLK